MRRRKEERKRGGEDKGERGSGKERMRRKGFFGGLRDSDLRGWFER